MDKTILIPLLISAVMLVGRKPADVYIWIFLPFLTFFPTYFDTKLGSGIPELHFWSAALVPIIAVWAVKSFKDYNYHWMDLIILLFILVIFYGHLVNNSYALAQKFIFNNMMAMFFPYILARTITEDRPTMTRMIRMMTYLCAFVALLNILECRIVTNYFDYFLRRIWPHYVMYDYGMMLKRWGYKRALGPFTHPIIAGNIFAMVTPLALWCYFQGHYLNKTIGRLVIGLNLMGVLVSISRAPIIGTMLGFIVIFYGWSKKKAAIMSVLSVVMLILFLVALPKLIEYASVTPATAKTEEQRNVALRYKMWQTYVDIVKERPGLGWGRYNIPSMDGLIDSIDAEYLRLALESGVIALCFYFIFLFGMLARIIRFAYGATHDDRWARLAWCLVAGWISTIFSLATVYAGGQSVHYLFMLGGVGHVLIMTSAAEIPPQEELAQPKNATGHGFNFKRTL